MRYVDLLIPLHQFDSLTFNHILLLEDVGEYWRKDLVFELGGVNANVEIPTSFILEVEFDVMLL